MNKKFDKKAHEEQKTKHACGLNFEFSDKEESNEEKERAVSALDTESNSKKTGAVNVEHKETKKR